MALKNIAEVSGADRMMMVRSSHYNELIRAANRWRNARGVGCRIDQADDNVVITVEGAGDGGSAQAGVFPFSASIEAPIAKGYELLGRTPEMVIAEVLCSLRVTGVVSTGDATPVPLQLKIYAVGPDDVVYGIASGAVSEDKNAITPEAPVHVPAGSRLFVEVTAGGVPENVKWSAGAGCYVQFVGSVETDDYAEAPVATDLHLDLFIAEVR